MLRAFGSRRLGIALDIVVSLGLVALAVEKGRVRRQGRGGIIVHSSASFSVYGDVRRIDSHMLWSGAHLLGESRDALDSAGSVDRALAIYSYY
jgi:hypothetical protein